MADTTASVKSTQMHLHQFLTYRHPKYTEIFASKSIFQNCTQQCLSYQSAKCFEPGSSHPPSTHFSYQSQCHTLDTTSMSLPCIHNASLASYQTPSSALTHVYRLLITSSTRYITRHICQNRAQIRLICRLMYTLYATPYDTVLVSTCCTHFISSVLTWKHREHPYNHHCCHIGQLDSTLDQHGHGRRGGEHTVTLSPASFM